MADAIGKVLAEERAKHRELVTRIVAIEKRAAPDDEAAAVFDPHDSDFANHDVMQHISFTVDSAAPDGAKAAHTISFVDTTTSEGNYVGFALDSIVVNDWLI